MTTLEAIERVAIALPKDQRLELAKKLISSVEEVGDIGVEEAWASEISRRIQQYRDGEAETVPAATVFDRLKEIAPNS